MALKQGNKNKRTLYLLGIGSGALVAALLCALLFFYRSYQTSLGRESESHLLEVSAQTAGSLDNILAGNRQLLQTIRMAFLAEYQNFSGDSGHLLTQMRVLGEALGDSGGFFLLNEDYLAYMPDGTRRSFALVEDIRELIGQGSDFTFLSGEADGSGRLYMVSPVEEVIFLNGERILGLGAYFDISGISFLLNQSLFGEPVSCYLLDSSGALIYQSNAARGSSAIQPFYYIQQFGAFVNTSYDEISDKISRREDGVASYTLEGQERYITYNNLESAPWVLAVSYGKSVVNSSMNDFTNSVLMVCVIVFACIVLILLLMSLLVYRNVKFAYRRALSEQERHLSELAEQVYDDQISVDMETMGFRHYRFREQSYLPLAETGDYTLVMQVFAGLLSPSDREVFEGLFTPALLHEHAGLEEKERPQSIEVCLDNGGQRRWIQLTRYLHKEQGRSFVTIMSRDITGEMELKEQLNRKNVELARANDAKSQFLANMSHDIRTPMNAIVGMTKIAVAHVEDSERVRDCLEKIEYSSHHLLSLINDVLDMSKIESGKLEINQVEFDLSEQISSIISIIAAQAKDHALELDVHIHNIRHEKLIGDSLRFNQVLINILGNSVKFTPSGGRVTLGVTELPMENEDQTRFLITITDTGIGMSKEFLPHLFDAFVQEKAGRNTQGRGTGLGMTISSSLVKLMGGTMSVESELEKGTSFTVELPFQLPGAPAVYERLPELRVLFVDDNAETCIETTRTLEEMGMCVQYALSGAQAIHMAEVAHRNNEDYQLAIIDWKMPGMNGIETAAYIRRSVSCDLPIIMLSAYDWSEVKEEARAAGIEEFMSKPLFKGTLYKRLVEWNQRRSAAGLGAQVLAKEPQSKPLEGRRFLLVDDNELNREIAHELLVMHGADVEEANDGALAVEEFCSHPVGYYDVILMDLQMPVMDGYEATAAIRGLDRQDADKVLILAVTADAFSEDIVRTRQAGMNAHIAKPIDFDQLNAILTKLFQDEAV